MPISQERMIALLDAAKDYKRALLHIHDKAHALLREVEAGATPIEVAFTSLVTFTAPRGLLGDEARTEATLAAETVHWRHAERRNLKERKRLARRRLDMGIEPAGVNTAPKRLTDTRPAKGENILTRGERTDPRTEEEKAAAKDNAELDIPEGDLAGMAEALPPEAKESIDEFLKKHGG